MMLLLSLHFRVKKLNNQTDHAFEIVNHEKEGANLHLHGFL